MTIESNKALVRRYAKEVFGIGDVALSDELLAPDYVHYSRSSGVTPNREGRKELVRLLHEAFGDMHLTIHDMVAEGDRVALRWTISGRHVGEYMGAAPTGKEVTWTGMSIHRVKGDQIAETWDRVDNLGVMMQLGLLKPPG